MEDQEIIALYFARNEEAIPATERRYGAYCGAIAQSILGDRQDEEECVADTWLRAWNAIPPQRPHSLRVFLGRITRNLALNRLRDRWAGKRGGGQGELALEELSQCVSGGETPEAALDRQAFRTALDSFLDQLPGRQRDIFLRRYWYLDSIAQIARRYSMGEGQTATLLYRLRNRLREHLIREGISL